MSSKASVSFEDVKKDLMIDEDFAREYEKLEPLHQTIEQMVRARKEFSMTQTDLAKSKRTKKLN